MIGVLVSVSLDGLVAFCMASELTAIPFILAVRRRLKAVRELRGYNEEAGECYDRHLTELAVKAPRRRARCLPCEYDASPCGPAASSCRPASPYGPEPHEFNEDPGRPAAMASTADRILVAAGVLSDGDDSAGCSGGPPG